MQRKSEPTFSQWLVTLSVPLVVLAVGALFRLLFDHETRMAKIEENCGKPRIATAEKHFDVPPPKVLHAEPQAPFVSLAYRFGDWLFSPGKASKQEKNP